MIFDYLFMMFLGLLFLLLLLVQGLTLITIIDLRLLVFIVTLIIIQLGMFENNMSEFIQNKDKSKLTLYLKFV
jgi:hypothetical protein